MLLKDEKEKCIEFLTLLKKSNKGDLLNIEFADSIHELSIDNDIAIVIGNLCIENEDIVGVMVRFFNELFTTLEDSDEFQGIEYHEFKSLMNASIDTIVMLKEQQRDSILKN